MDMELDVLDGAITRVRLMGRMDTSGIDAIETRFTAALVAPGRSAVVDLARVTFLASMGVRMLIACARGLKNKGYKLVLYGAPDRVQEVLETVALDLIIPVVSSQQDAVALI